MARRFLDLLRRERRARRALGLSLMLGVAAVFSGLLCLVLVPTAMRTAHWLGWAFSATWIAFPVLQILGVVTIWAWPAWPSRRRMLVVAAVQVIPLASWAALAEALDAGYLP